MLTPASKDARLPSHGKHALDNVRERRSPKPSRWLWVLLLAVASALAYVVAFHNFNQKPHQEVFEPPPHQTNFTDLVQWDKYSLFIHGQRVFLWSGEFHTFRLPVPDLWIDILQKMKAMGMNAVSVYLYWGLIHPAPGVIDFEGFRAIQPLFDACKAAGIFIILRPGPYINAEVNAGGIPSWVTSEVAGHLRTNASDYYDTWSPYMDAVIKLTLGNQITDGGPVIAVQVDNEYTDKPDIGHPGKVDYFLQLMDKLRKGGIVVPLTYNDPTMADNYARGRGAVDIYGLDSYPQGFDCTHPYDWKPVTENYYDYHMNTNPDQPYYIPEFQGGAFDPWGPSAPGYESCGTLTGPDFVDVFDKHLWAHNVKLINIYMIYGGTSWGSIPSPWVYTSYDYGAAIMESRDLNDKFDEYKLQGIFLRSAPEFYKTDWKGNSTDGSNAVWVDNERVFATALVNPDTHAGFYVTRHLDSTSRDNSFFRIAVQTSLGELDIPWSSKGIQLDGRQSKLIVTDFAFGDSRLIYSTTTILFAGKIDNRDVLYLFGDDDQTHEVLLPLTGNLVNPHLHNLGRTIEFSPNYTSGYTLITFLPSTRGLITLWDSDTQLILYSDKDIASTFFAPVIPSSNSDPSSVASQFAQYWQFGSNETVLVGGGLSLVRSADIVGSTLDLRGDFSYPTEVIIIGPSRIRSATWNGRPFEEDVAKGLAVSHTGAFVGRISPSKQLAQINRPVIKNWKFKDGLPEIKRGYSDWRWTVADHETTNSPQKPRYGPPPVLYGCDYGFCEGTVLWRGHFKGTPDTTAVNLCINGGEAFAASVWINDRFIKTTYGNSTANRNIIEETNDWYNFPPGSVRQGRDNVVTILQDNQGLAESDDFVADSSKSPRGIRGVDLMGGSFHTWKVQGKLGGYNNFVDRVRGISNEGGTFGERSGWHLPGFDVSGWEDRDLSQGLPNNASGVGVFVTHFKIDHPSGFDIKHSFEFTTGDEGQPYRAYLYVNGWQMGKRVANLGPQTIFPVHEGILDYHGTNTVVVVLWAMEPVAVTPKLVIRIDSIVEGGVGEIKTNNPPWERRPSV